MMRDITLTHDNYPRLKDFVLVFVYVALHDRKDVTDDITDICPRGVVRADTTIAAKPGALRGHCPRRRLYPWRGNFRALWYCSGRRGTRRPPLLRARADRYYFYRPALR